MQKKRKKKKATSLRVIIKKMSPYRPRLCVSAVLLTGRQKMLEEPYFINLAPFTSSLRRKGNASRLYIITRVFFISFRSMVISGGQARWMPRAGSPIDCRTETHTKDRCHWRAHFTYWEEPRSEITLLLNHLNYCSFVITGQSKCNRLWRQMEAPF